MPTKGPDTTRQRPSTRQGRRAREPVALQTKFKPRFLDDVDQRQAVVKTIRRMIERIKTETGCKTLLREILIEELVFLVVLNATARAAALEGGPYDQGVMTQATNAISGLAVKLGIDKLALETIDGDLASYIAKQRAKGEE